MEEVDKYKGEYLFAIYPIMVRGVMATVGGRGIG